MKHTYFIIFWLLLAIFAICPKIQAQALGDFQTNGNVTFAAITNWQRHNGTSFVAATAGQIPSSADGVITIRNGHTANITSATTLDQVVIKSGGILSRGAGSLIIADGVGDDIIVENGGLFILNISTSTGEPTFNPSTATMLIKTGGILRTDKNNGDSDSFANDENAAYTGKTTFEDGAIFEWNTANAFDTGGILGKIYFPTANATTIPIFRMSVNSGTIGANTPTTFNGTFEANANVTWQGTGIKTFRNGITGIGDVTQNTATTPFQITGTNAKLGGTGKIILNTLGLQITNTADVTMTSNKTIDDINAAGNAPFTVAGILDCETFNLIAGAGTSNFTLNSAATLKMGSPQGITSSGATGNIQLTGTRTFNSAANYEYKGTAAQVTGNGLPATLNALLTINNTAATPTVTQTAATQKLSGTNSQMVLKLGNYTIAANNLVFEIANVPITRTGGKIATIATSNITFGNATPVANLAGNAFTLPNDLFVASTSLNNFIIDRTNNLTLGNQGFLVIGTLGVGANGVADLDLNGNNIDLGTTGTLSEDRPNSRVVFDNTVTDFDAIKGGFIRATSRNLNGINIAGLGIDITNGTAGTVNIDRYHCKVKGKPVESIKKVFDITASVGANNATMTINYSPQDLIGTTLSDATASFRLHRGKSGVIAPWTMQTSPAAIGLCHNTVAKTVFADNIASFSPWSAAPETTILPVNLIFFKATKQQNNFVELTWQTATEENHNTFEIQKSINGDNFTTIAFVKNIDKQNSNIAKNYSFLDNQCLQTSYYRIKQIDNDGKFTYSKIETIAMDFADNQDFAITPNPFSNKITIHTTFAKDAFVSIYLTDLLGMSLVNFEGKLADIEIKLCKKIENLPSGVYFISIWNEKNKIVQKIVKLQ